MFNNAVSLIDPRVPQAKRPETLSGDRAGEHGIRINDRWRLRFEWKDGDAHGVEIADYR